MKILILGGYGVFGGRLAHLLSDISKLELLIAGRNAERASAFCDALSGPAHAFPTVLDRNDIGAGLAQHRPDLVVDASGPFQDYGDDPYLVVKACITAQCNYMDFADAAGFVFGISEFDQQAQKAGVYVLSGVSSFPVLTAAVIREMSKEMHVEHVSGGIAPSPYAGIGLNVMRAVIGYAGSPVKLRRNGQDTKVAGLTESMRYTIAVPGRIPLRNIHFSLVEVPDLQVIPVEYPNLQSIWMGAGPVPEGLHRVLNLLAKARTVLNLPSYAPLAPFFYRVLNLAKFGEHRGGMFVHAEGTKNGTPHSMSWHLLAEGDDGPFIPSMAIETIVRKQLGGTQPKTGARPATNALELSDYDIAFKSKTIYSGFRQDTVTSATLYQQVMGSAFDQLPPPLKALHSVTNVHEWQGHAHITAASNPVAKFVARLVGFPTRSQETDAKVILTKDAKGELWERQFGVGRFHSHQRLGTGRNAHLLMERFGPFDFALAVTLKDGRLGLVPRRWSFLGIPLPKTFIPEGNTFEHAEGGEFNFDVTIKAPIIGHIVAYKGVLNQTV